MNHLIANHGRIAIFFNKQCHILRDLICSGKHETSHQNPTLLRVDYDDTLSLSASEALQEYEEAAIYAFVGMSWKKIKVLQDRYDNLQLALEHDKQKQVTMQPRADC